MTEAALERGRLVERGKRLEYFTIAWNLLEGLVGLLAGAVAGSISLIGFGFDSLIEVTSGSALLWRMSADGDACTRERKERVALRIVGLCFLALAVYVGYESLSKLAQRQGPAESLPGIVLACASLIAMPLLARAKRRVAKGLSSGALRADARQTEFCVWLSAILLAGLLLNSVWSLWWADSVAALAMVPMIAWEGVQALRGETCCD